MLPPPHNARRRKQVKILFMLIVALLMVSFSPMIRVIATELLPRRPFRLGRANISIPKDWGVLPPTAQKLGAVRTCRTIFCRSSLRASVVFESSNLPANSDDVWESASRKIFQKDHSSNTYSFSISGPSVAWKCLDFEAPASERQFVMSCMSWDLALTSVASGDI
jgi:hypothetical protein